MTRGTRLALIITSFLGLAHHATARYTPPSLSNLAGVSDVVVLGTIVKVEPGTFTLRSDEMLAGSAPGPELVIVRFTDWMCWSRWKPHAVGQHEIAFLRALPTAEARRTGARCGLRSAGAEAEWEVQGDRVSVPGFHIPSGTVDAAGSHPDQWLSLTDVLDALRTYRQCFSLFPNPRVDWSWPIVHVVCDSPGLEAFRRRSAFHEYLARTSLERSTR